MRHGADLPLAFESPPFPKILEIKADTVPACTSHLAERDVTRPGHLIRVFDMETSSAGKFTDKDCVKLKFGVGFDLGEEKTEEIVGHDMGIEEGLAYLIEMLHVVRTLLRCRMGANMKTYFGDSARSSQILLSDVNPWRSRQSFWDGLAKVDEYEWPYVMRLSDGGA